MNLIHINWIKYNISLIYPMIVDYNIIKREEMVRKKDNKKDDQLIKLALVTAVISLLNTLIELIIKIIELLKP